MKIGFVQFSPTLGDFASTMQDLDGLSGTFATADLVVLPELCNSGYNFVSIEQARSLAEDAQTGAFVHYLLSLCQRHDQYIVAGINERDGETGKLYNTAVLIGPEGTIGRYRKLHLFLNEKDIFQPGDLGLPVFDLGVCKVGMLICFDWIFPEAWRVLALKGADLICHPANLVIPGLAQRALPVHAVMNRIFVATANRTGQEGSLKFTGMSTIAGPTGEVLAQASETDTAVRVVDIDVSLAKDKMITPRNHVLADRRPEAYADLLKPHV
jgi:predicted amidohydrolase